MKLLLTAAAVLFASPCVAAPIVLEVDATDVPRRILHARLTIPAEPGPLTLLYPKWIPGTHSPTGPITDLAGFAVSAGGKALAWTRDDADVYAVHLTVPAGEKVVQVALDLLLPGLSDPPTRQQTVASAKLLVLNWGDLLVYPKSATALKTTFSPTLKMPDGWRYGTALAPDDRSKAWHLFAETTLETLIDSPTLCGEFTREVPIGPAAGKHRVFLAADSEAALDVPAETKASWDKLVTEAEQLFGSRPYGSYTFLLALTDKIRTRGLEHHESSDNRLPEATLGTPHLRSFSATLFPHEYVHSWNGKFRRPADMLVPDYQTVPKTKLLWVYEGLTNYLAWVLTARCGGASRDGAFDKLAVTAEKMTNTPGRKWRPLEDTASASHLLFASGGAWASWRRSVDFYDEGTLLWLEVDVTVRRESKGTKSLDDFCRAFFACEPGRPAPKGYALDDVGAALNGVQPYDWKALFTRRVTLPADDAPLDGITLGGWRLSYQDKPSDTVKAAETISKGIDLSSSLGLRLTGEGTVQDVVPDKPGAKAGLAPGMKLTAVNGRKFTADLMRASVAATAKGGKLELLAENGDFFKTHEVVYKDGAKYPKLDRSMAEPDLLSEIVKPRGK